MLEIEISYTWGSDEPTLTSLVEEFGQKHGIQAHLRRLDWTNAWVELFKMASEGQGSDVSIIGTTWVSTLAKMDALRPYKGNEIADLGGDGAFIAPLWQGTKLAGDPRVWSIPWTGWMYLIAYRKDLLESIGLDPARAFDNPPASRETLAALQACALEVPWLNADIAHPYSDFLHIAASWVWAAGGEFINSAGTQSLFDTPEALAGLTDWLDSYRVVRPQYQQLSVAECRDLLRSGRAAAGLVDINSAQTLLDPRVSSVPPQNFGFSNISAAPWVGGGTMVVWGHTQMHPERERAAVELVKFLAGKDANLRWMRESSLLPPRLDAIQETYPEAHPLHELVSQVAGQGRSYHNVSHWRRFEARVSLELGAIVQQARQDPAANSLALLRKHLLPLAAQLNGLLQVR